MNWNWITKFFKKTEKNEDNSAENAAKQEAKFFPNGKSVLVLNSGADTTPNINSLMFYFKDSQKMHHSDVLFVTTKEDEEQKRRENFRKAIIDNVPEFFEKGNQFFFCIVDPSDKSNVTKTLASYFDNNYYDNVCVNITLGTKILALAEYDFFKENEKIYGWRWLNLFYHYLPLDKESTKLISVYPERTFRHKDVSTDKRSVSSWFSGLGNIGVFTESVCAYPAEYIIKRLDVFFDGKNKEIVADLTKIADQIYHECPYSTKNVSIDFDKQSFAYYRNEMRIVRNFNKSLLHSDINSYREYFKKIGIAGIMKYKQLFFACNGWFEELTYYLVKRKYGLTDDMCAINVTYTNKGSRNELDVVFIDESNKLNIIECKNSAKPEILRAAIDKKNTISKHFGLNTKFQLWTTGSRKTIHPNVLARAKADEVELVTRDEIMQMVEELYKGDLNYNL